MSWKFHQILETLKRRGQYKLLKDCGHGIERETLRVNENGELAQTTHPKALGSALTNPFITTDFAEPQLELVTPTYKTEDGALNSLKNIHIFINKNLEKGEMMWHFSMPCKLPAEKNIPLAQYGKSREGQKKTDYRLGLSHRYGRKMQTVCGTHYNFSFSDKFWEYLRKKFAPKMAKQDFISESYLKLIRNFLRIGWLNTYLFGAAPVVDKSYLCKKYKFLKRLDWNTRYAPYGTSFRMSELGYYSKVQAQLAISFNDLKSYLYDLRYAVSMQSPHYKGLPGLNDHILQIENEHYSRIRPKPQFNKGERPLDALAKGGIKYVEVRAVDINPYEPIGLKKEQLCFLQTLLVYCLFKESPRIEKKEECEITGNQNKVAIFGRDPELKLKKHGTEIYMKNWAMHILDEVAAVAALLDKNCESSVKSQRMKLEDPALTPSYKILEDLKKSRKSYAKFGLELARQHQKYFETAKIDSAFENKLKEAAEKSIKDQENLEVREAALLEGHEDLEVSTQILIREARKRKVNVEILDRHNNFILLSRGRKQEYVQQATKTSKDSLITYLIMGNKKITKQILAENFIKVPWGESFINKMVAKEAYGRFFNLKIVIKPTTTNYGVGISFINPGDLKSYKTAVDEAFKHDQSIVVEEFIEGREYRFLTINYKTISVLKRIPANVTGDGGHSISELIDLKNEDAHYYKFFNDYILRKGAVERQHLKEQGLSLSSVPKKGKTIFLRTNSNVSTGGDPVDCTDEISENYKKIAEKAARIVKAKICGIDMIIGKNNYAIIELNFNPALQMHEYPVKGKARPAARAVLNLLGF